MPQRFRFDVAKRYVTQLSIKQKHLFNAKSNIKSLNRLFNILDTNKDGFVTPKDFQFVYQSEKLKQSPDEISQFIKQQMQTTNSDLNFEAFCQFLNVGDLEQNNLIKLAYDHYVNEDFSERIEQLRNKKVEDNMTHNFKIII